MIRLSTSTDRPTVTVANPGCEPTDAWIRSVAAMLLRDVDAEREAQQKTPAEVHQTQAGVNSESYRNDNTD